MNIMKTIKFIFSAIGGILFLISIISHIYVNIRLRQQNSELDECYYEFEDQHPSVAKYRKWSRITFAGAVIGALVLFLTIAI